MVRNFLLVIIVLIVGCASHSSAIDPQAHADMGLRYLQQGDVRRAEQHLQRAMQEAPDSVDALDAMAYYEESLQENTRAEVLYQQAVKRHPQSANAHNNWGTFLCRHGRYREAIQQFTLASEIPRYVNVARAYENAGICAALIPDCDLAKQFLTRALAHDPSLQVARLVLDTLCSTSNAVKSPQFLTSKQP